MGLHSRMYHEAECGLGDIDSLVAAGRRRSRLLGRVRSSPLTSASLTAELPGQQSGGPEVALCHGPISDSRASGRRSHVAACLGSMPPRGGFDTPTKFMA